MRPSFRYSILTVFAVLTLGVALSASRLTLPGFVRGVGVVAQVRAIPTIAGDDAARDVSPGVRVAREVIVQTDKPDYAPGEVIVVTGSGWDPGEAVTLLLQEDPKMHGDRKIVVVADASGAIFDNQFMQDADGKPITFRLTAKGESSGLTTQTAFGNPSADLDQWANKDSAWVNGNLGASKAAYFEGDSIPYRLRFGNLPLSAHTVTFEWDTTKSSKHALDYVTTFNRSVPTLLSPCAGVSGCTVGGFTTAAIPVDPQVTGAGVTPIAGNFRIYGGTFGPVSTYSYSNGTGFTGDKSARITLTFTPSVANPVITWGGHIATRVDWGTFNSAVNITGSPYHTRLVDLDGSGGNQDRSLSSDATIFPVKITIIKDAVPNDGQDFHFATGGGTLSPASFDLDDDSNGTLPNTQVYSLISTFTTYTFTETAVSHWTLSFGTPACSVTGANGGSFNANAGTGVLSLTVKEGEEFTCTFINTHSVSSPTISTTLSGTSVAIGTSVHDSATLSNASSDAGGTVTYTVYSDSSCSTGAQAAGTKTVTSGVVPDSNAITFNSAGDFYWQAVYSGDGNNNGATSTCTEEHLVVNPNGPSTSTQVKNNAGNGNIADDAHVAIGTVAYDSSSLSGATSGAGGTVTYHVVKGTSCSGGTSLGTKTVTNGSVPNSDTYTFTSAGTYNFWAVYSGDDNNSGSTSTCGTETVIVDQREPSIATLLSSSSVAIGASVHDSSTLTGATTDAGGTVTYTVFSDAGCSQGSQSAGTKTVTNGVVPDSDAIQFNSAGDFYWQAVYSGDANNKTATSTCTEEHLVVSPNQPSNSTAQTLTPNDSFTLTGATSNAGGTVTFNLFSPSDATCGGTPALTETVDVSGNGTYSTSNTTFFATTEGTWRWLVSYSGDANNQGSTSACGVERFTIANQ